MKPHRFDPFSLVIGLATAVFGALLLWGDLGVSDLRPSHLWPFPVLVLGLLLTLYGLRRLFESARAAMHAEAAVPDQPESSSIQD